MSAAYDANEFYTGSDLLRPISEATGLSIDKVLLTTRRAAHWVSFLNIRRFDNIITTTQVTFFCARSCTIEKVWMASVELG